MSDNNVNSTQIGAVSTFSMPTLQQVYSQIFTLTSGQTVNLDFKPLVNQHKVSSIQGVYIDNSLGTATFTLLVVATLQLISIPAGYQGIMPLYMTADNVVQLTGNGTVPVIFNNFPTPAAVWKAS